MRRLLPWSLFLLSSTLLLAAGCPSSGGDDDDTGIDDDDAGDDDDATPPGGCGWPDGGADGAASISPGSPVVLDTQQSQAMNTLDLEFDGPLSPMASQTLAVGPCGDAGLLMFRDGQSVLAFVDPVAGGTPEDVGPNSSPFSGALLYDADCAALILSPTSATEITEYTREGPGSWSSAAALANASPVLGEEPSFMTVFDAGPGADGRLYLFVAASVSDGTAWMRGARDADAGATWTFEEIEFLGASEMYDMAVGPTGETAAVYKNTQYPCDPCDVDFYLGLLASPGDSWSSEVVQPGKWGDPNDEFVEAASVAFGPGGQPYIAAHFGERVITGSYVATELRIYGEADGDWCAEVVADANDGYEGTDGGTFTGADPQLVVDGEGRMHVAYRDQAIWHDGNNWQNEIRGQIRYAVRAGHTWSSATLLTQPGQTASGNPLIGVGAPLLAVSSDGSEVIAAGVAFEWETDSIYNKGEYPVTLEAVAVPTAVSNP